MEITILNVWNIGQFSLSSKQSWVRLFTDFVQCTDFKHLLNQFKIFWLKSEGTDTMWSIKKFLSPTSLQYKQHNENPWNEKFYRVLKRWCICVLKAALLLGEKVLSLFRQSLYLHLEKYNLDNNFSEREVSTS